MKNWGILGFVLLTHFATQTMATESYYLRYGYPVDAVGTNPAAPQQYIQTPKAGQYGFYGQQSRAGANPRYITGGNPYAATPRQSVYDNQNSYYSSPVFKEETRTRAKLYYLGAHGGLGGTFGWDNGEKKPIKPILGVVAGTWATPDIRLDAEFDYHVKGNLSKKSEGKKTYKQYDLGANAYYDFPMTRYGFQPFVGGGLWLIKKMVTAQNSTTHKDESHSGWKLGLSAAAGLAFPINDNWRISSMLRARYIVTNEGLYNLEALIGAQYAF